MRSTTKSASNQPRNEHITLVDSAFLIRRAEFYRVLM